MNKILVANFRESNLHTQKTVFSGSETEMRSKNAIVMEVYAPLWKVAVVMEQLVGFDAVDGDREMRQRSLRAVEGILRRVRSAAGDVVQLLGLDERCLCSDGVLLLTLSEIVRQERGHDNALAKVLSEAEQAMVVLLRIRDKLQEHPDLEVFVDAMLLAHGSRLRKATETALMAADLVPDLDDDGHVVLSQLEP